MTTTTIATPKVRGAISFDKLKEMVASDDITTVVIGYTDMYGKLCGKRLDAEFFLDNTSTMGCNYMFACDINNTPYGGKFLFWGFF